VTKQAAQKTTRPKNAPVRAARGIASDPTIAEIASIKFRRRNLDLSAGMTNDDLGRFMPAVRLAIIILDNNKADMIAMVAAMDDGDLLKPDGAATDLLASLLGARDKFRGLSDICDEGVRRLLIAAHAAAVRTDGSEGAH
jgi:hypothetical protein